MELSDSYDLYLWLEDQDLLAEKLPLWWPEYGTFEVLVGAILTQNTKWEKVERSLQNLRSNHLLSLVALNECESDLLMRLIQPSGLYKSKANYLQKLVYSIVDAYGDFETFVEEVDREWLLAQKGVGPETADSILCYACRRPEMVVDAYTARLLVSFGLEYEAYDDIKAWCSEGLQRVFDESQLPEKYALFHGMIVEYVKANSKGKTVRIDNYI
ncbi:MAG: 3-methyladenine DNA glycosylase [Campylobacterota bacterium]|nr:3-methyladenine DNA glycosylase [Campylobacterota bacterium]